MNFELSEDARKDPTHTLWIINEFEGAIDNLFGKLAPKFSKLIPKVPGGGNLEQIQESVDETITAELLDPILKLSEEYIPKAYVAGDAYAEIQLGRGSTVKEHIQMNQFGIKLGGTPEERRAAWKQLADLITSSNGSFKGMTDDMANKVKQIIGAGIINESSFQTMMDQIEKATGISMTRAYTIIQTEIMKSVNKGLLTKYKNTGVEFVEWVTIDDSPWPCFIKNTCVLTSDGNKPIQDISVGDMILTRYGFKPVIETHKNRYCGDLIQIYTSDDGGFVCTSNHPIYIVGEGWLRARDVQEGHTLQTSDNKFPQVVRIHNIGFPHSNNCPSVFYQESIFLRVFNRIFVPIRTVCFNGNFRFRNNKVDRVFSNRSFLNEVYSKFSKHLSYFYFKCTFSSIFSVTRKTTKSSGFFSTWDYSKFFPALLTGYYNLWTAAFFRTINLFWLCFSSKSISCIKFIPTCGANAFKFRLFSGDSLAYNSTSDLGFSAGHNEKYLSTNRTNFFNSIKFSGSPITFKRAIFPIFNAIREHEYFSTTGACFFDSGILRIVKAFTGTIFNCFCMSIKINTTKLTNFYNGYQSLTIFDKLAYILLGNITTYNLSVKDDPVYFANGYLVHNCGICFPRDGNVYPIDDHPIAPSHPRCRCSFHPKIMMPEDEPE